MKKSLSLLLAMLMVFTLVAIPALADVEALSVGSVGNRALDLSAFETGTLITGENVAETGALTYAGVGSHIRTGLTNGAAAGNGFINVIDISGRTSTEDGNVSVVELGGEKVLKLSASSSTEEVTGIALTPISGDALKKGEVYAGKFAYYQPNPNGAGMISLGIAKSNGTGVAPSYFEVNDPVRTDWVWKMSTAELDGAKATNPNTRWSSVVNKTLDTLMGVVALGFTNAGVYSPRWQYIRHAASGNYYGGATWNLTTASHVAGSGDTATLDAMGKWVYLDYQLEYEEGLGIKITFKSTLIEDSYTVNPATAVIPMDETELADLSRTDVVPVLAMGRYTTDASTQPTCEMYVKGIQSGILWTPVNEGYVELAEVGIDNLNAHNFAGTTWTDNGDGSYTPAADLAWDLASPVNTGVVKVSFKVKQVGTATNFIARNTTTSGLADGQTQGFQLNTGALSRFRMVHSNVGGNVTANYTGNDVDLSAYGISDITNVHEYTFYLDFGNGSDGQTIQRLYIDGKLINTGYNKIGTDGMGANYLNFKGIQTQSGTNAAFYAIGMEILDDATREDDVTVALGETDATVKMYTGTAEVGDVVRAVVAAKDGFTFDGWDVNGEIVSTDLTADIEIPAADNGVVTITPVFTAPNLKADGGIADFSVKAPTEYEFDWDTKWTDNGDGSYTPDNSVYWTFKEPISSGKVKIVWDYKLNYDDKDFLFLVGNKYAGGSVKDGNFQYIQVKTDGKVNYAHSNRIADSATLSYSGAQYKLGAGNIYSNISLHDKQRHTIEMYYDLDGDTVQKIYIDGKIYYNGYNIMPTAGLGSDYSTITHIFANNVQNRISLYRLGVERLADSDLPDEATITVAGHSEDNSAATVNGFDVDGGKAYVYAGTAHVGDVLAAVAVPNSGYEFEGWYNGDVKVADTAVADITVTGDMDLTPKFVKEQVTITIVGDGCTPANTSVKIDKGGVLSAEDVAATVASGHAVKHYLVNGGSAKYNIENLVKVNFDADATVTIVAAPFYANAGILNMETTSPVDFAWRGGLSWTQNDDGSWTPSGDIKWNVGTSGFNTINSGIVKVVLEYASKDGTTLPFFRVNYDDTDSQASLVQYVSFVKNDEKGEYVQFAHSDGTGNVGAEIRTKDIYNKSFFDTDKHTIEFYFDLDGATVQKIAFDGEIYYTGYNKMVTVGTENHKVAKLYVGYASGLNIYKLGIEELDAEDLAAEVDITVAGQSEDNLSDTTSGFDAVGGRAYAYAGKARIGDVLKVGVVTANGWTFEGWYNGETKLADTAVASIEVTGAMDITPKFSKPKYKITFNAGEHGTIDGEDKVVYELYEGNIIHQPEVTPDAGWIFTGWDGEFSTAVEDVEYTANYKAIEYKVTFKADENEIISEAIYTYGQTPVVPEAPAKDGYTFVGWDKEVVNVTESATYTAVYEANDYTVKFVIDGEETVVTGKLGDALDAPTIPAKDHFTAAWDAEVPATIEGDATFTAVYTAIEYTVTFVIGDETTEVKGVYGADLTAPVIPAKDHFTAAWDKEVPATIEGDATYTAEYTAIYYTVVFVIGGERIERVGTFGTALEVPEIPAVANKTAAWDVTPTDTIEGNATYTAVYADVIYTVTFVIGDETVEVNGIYGAELEVPELPEVAHKTAAWDNEPTATIEGNATYTAVYTDVIYTVTFVIDGETTEVKGVYGAELTAPVIPAKDHFTAAWDAEVPATIEGDATFTAVYTAVEYTVTFVIDGETTEVKGVYGAELTAPVIPAKDHFTAAWDNEPTAKIEGNATYTAVYTDVIYTVTFVADDETVDTVTGIFGTALTAPKAPEKADYRFIGWTPEVTATIEGDATYEAQYEAINYVATANGVKYETLAEAVAVGGEIVLLDDVTLTEKLTVEADQTWNFGDYTLTTAAVEDNYSVVVKGNLVIESGNIEVNGVYGIGVLGTLEVNGGVLTAAADNDYLIGNWGTTTINDGKLTGVYNVVNNFAGTTTVTGGTFVTAETDASGEYESADILGNEGVLVLDGTFSKPVDEAYCEEGYTSVENGDGTYSIGLKEYTITFVVDGETVGTVTGNLGDAINAPEIPAKEHFTAAWDAEVPATIEGDATFTAVYTAIEYTVTFVIEGEEIVVTGVYGAELNAPVIPAKDHFTAAWDKAVPATIEGDATFTAVYTDVIYTVTFVADGETVDTVTGIFGTALAAPEAPEKADYRFIGWTPEVTATIEGDATYTAVYEAIDYVARANGVGYESIEDAIAAGGEIVLLKDVTVDSILKIEKDTVLDLNGKTITGTASKAIEVYADATIKNGTVVGVDRAVDTRKAVELTLEDVVLNTTGAGNNQALTIGGSENGTEVLVKDSELNAGASGYGVIVFVESDITVEASEINGYAALYFKEGSAGTTATVDEASVLNAAGHAGEEFGAIATEETDLDITVNGTVNMEEVEGADNAAILFIGEADNNKVALNGAVNGTVINNYTEGAVVTTTNKDVADAIVEAGFVVKEVNGEYTVAGTPVATADGVAYATLAEAVAVGGEIVLLDDVTLTEKLTVEADQTWNFGEYTLTTAAVEGNYSVVVKGDLVIESGNIEVNGVYGIGVLGTLEVNGGVLTAAADNDYLIGNWGTTTINDGEFTGVYNVVNNFAGTTTVNGGTFVTEATDASGEYESADILGDDGVLVLGGTFSKPVDEAYCEEGYASKDNGDGTYSIDLKVYTITFVAAEGGALEGNTVLEVKHGAAIVAPTPVANDGYVFDGWDVEIPATATADLTITAQFAKAKYTVTFIVGEKGTTEDATEFEAEYGDVITVPVVTANDEYEFTGWDPTIAGDTITVTGDATYVALYGDVVLLKDITAYNDADATIEYNPLTKTITVKASKETNELGAALVPTADDIKVRYTMETEGGRIWHARPTNYASYYGEAEGEVLQYVVRREYGLEQTVTAVISKGDFSDTYTINYVFEEAKFEGFDSNEIVGIRAKEDTFSVEVAEDGTVNVYIESTKTSAGFQFEIDEAAEGVYAGTYEGTTNLYFNVNKGTTGGRLVQVVAKKAVAEEQTFTVNLTQKPKGAAKLTINVTVKFI